MVIVGRQSTGVRGWTHNGLRDRVIRGGSWDSNAVDCRSAVRYAVAPDCRSSGLGFRLSRTLP
jgi:formylglycine-generating enzyme required for sulfatase activity